MATDTVKTAISPGCRFATPSSSDIFLRSSSSSSSSSSQTFRMAQNFSETQTNDSRIVESLGCRPSPSSSAFSSASASSSTRFPRPRGDFSPTSSAKSVFHITPNSVASKIMFFNSVVSSAANLDSHHVVSSTSASNSSASLHTFSSSLSSTSSVSFVPSRHFSRRSSICESSSSSYSCSSSLSSSSSSFCNSSHSSLPLPSLDSSSGTSHRHPSLTCPSPRKYGIYSHFWCICNQGRTGVLLHPPFPSYLPLSAPQELSTTSAHLHQYAFLDVSLFKLAQLERLSDEKRSQQFHYVTTYQDLSLSLEFPPLSWVHRQQSLLLTLKGFLDACSSLRALEVTVRKKRFSQRNSLPYWLCQKKGVGENNSPTVSAAAIKPTMTEDVILEKREKGGGEEEQKEKEGSEGAQENFELACRSLWYLVCRSLSNLETLFLDHHLTQVLARLMSSSSSSHLWSNFEELPTLPSTSRVTFPSLTCLHIVGGVNASFPIFSQSSIIATNENSSSFPPPTQSTVESTSPTTLSSVLAMKTMQCLRASSVVDPSFQNSTSLNFLNLLHVPNLQLLHVTIGQADDFLPFFHFLRFLRRFHSTASLTKSNSPQSSSSTSLRSSLFVELIIEVNAPNVFCIPPALLLCSAVYLPIVRRIEINYSLPLSLLICSRLEELHISSSIKPDLLILCVNTCRNHLQVLHIQQITTSPSSCQQSYSPFVLPSLQRYSGTVQLFMVVPELYCPRLSHLQLIDIEKTCQQEIYINPSPLYSTVHLPPNYPENAPISSSSTTVSLELSCPCQDSPLHRAMQSGFEQRVCIEKEDIEKKRKEVLDVKTVDAVVVRFLRRHRFTIEHLTCDMLPCESGDDSQHPLQTKDYSPLEFKALKTLDVIPTAIAAAGMTSDFSSSLSATQITDVRIPSYWLVPALQKLHVQGRVSITNLHLLLDHRAAVTRMMAKTTSPEPQLQRCQPPPSPYHNNDQHLAPTQTSEVVENTEREWTTAAFSQLRQLSVYTLQPKCKNLAAHKEVLCLLTPLSRLQSLQVVTVTGIHPYALQLIIRSLGFTRSEKPQNLRHSTVAASGRGSPANLWLTFERR